MIVYLNQATREALRNMKVFHPFPFAFVDKAKVNYQRNHVREQHGHLNPLESRARAVARVVSLKRNRDWKAIALAIAVLVIIYLLFASKAHAQFTHVDIIKQNGVAVDNTGLPIKCLSGCGAAATDTTGSGVLGSLNATLQIAMVGQNSAAVTLPAANNLVGALLAESSSDGGTTWAATVIRSSASTGLWASSQAVSSTNASYNIQVPGGASHVRVRVNPYTSGAATASIRATTQPDSQPDPLVQGTQAAGSATQPNPQVMGGWDGAAVRSFKTDSSGVLQMTLPTQPFLNVSDFNDVVAHTPVLGDIIAVNSTPKYAAVAGSTSATDAILAQVGTGSVSALPSWRTTTGNTGTPVVLQTGASVSPQSINGGIFMADQYSGATGKLKIENCMLTNLGYRLCIAPMGLDASSNIAATTAPANSYVIDMRGAATVQSGQNCMYCFWGGPNGGGAARWFYGFAANRANDFPFSRMFIYNELTTTEWGGGYPLGADLDILARGASDLHLVNDASSTTQVATTSVTAGTAVSVAVTSTANFPTPNTSLWGVAPNYGTLTVSDSNGANIEFLSGVAGACTTGLLTVNGQYCLLDATHFIIRTAISHTQPYNISQQGRMYLDVGRMACNAKAFAGDTQKRPCYFTDSGASLNATLAIPSDTSATWPFSGIGHGVALTGTDATGAHNNLMFRNNTSADSILTQNAAGTTIWTQADGGTLTAGSTAILDLNAASGTTGLKIPVAAGAAPTANGNIAYDSTANKPVAGVNGTSFKLPIIVASGTSALTTAGITTGACGTTVTTAATGALTTDRVDFTRNAAPTNANGGNLILNSWVTAGNINWNYCNPSAGTVTPTAMTVNWAVMR